MSSGSPGSNYFKSFFRCWETSMVRQTRAVTCVLAMLLLFCAAPARSTPLAPGATGIVPTALGPFSSISPTFVFDFGPQLFTFGPVGQQVTVRFGEAIFKDPFTPLFACGADCLDFVLEAQLVSGPAGATTLLTSISMNTFGTSAVDVDWLLDHPTYAAPTTADRGPLGDVVSFDFAPGIPTGAGVDTSQILVIRTDRTSFSPQDFVGFAATETFAAGGQPLTPSGLFSVQTQAVPEPSTMMLVLGGAAFGAFRKRRIAAKPQKPAR
jgi:PEP-CTERM motif